MPRRKTGSAYVHRDVGDAKTIGGRRFHCTGLLTKGGKRIHKEERKRDITTD